MTPPSLRTTFTGDIAHISPNQLTGFFVGWPSPPTPEEHFKILKGSKETYD